MSKEEVLKLKNHYNTEYYCKNDICTLIKSKYNNLYIDIPDVNGNNIKYIVYTCTYDDIELNECFDDEYIDNIKYYLNCNNDSECLSNKCYKSHCVYNNETSIDHCIDIYSYDLFEGGSSYMNCGKPPNDNCKKNDDCSSKYCSKDNYCIKQNSGPSDSDSTQPLIKLIATIAIITLIIVTIIITIICVFCCYIGKHKN